MTTLATGQLILGTDKRNPLFLVYADEEEDRLHVYYGLELLEKVSADREDPNFKMLVGRLYNARLNRRVLAETFQADRKTLRRWGQALCSGDAQQLVRGLAGARAKRKLTPEIVAYARARGPELRAQGPHRISGQLRREIQAVFGVKLSSETLRPLVRELKQGANQAQSEPGVQRPEPALPVSPIMEGSAAPIASILPESEKKVASSQGVSSLAGESACDKDGVGLVPPPPPPFPQEALVSEAWPTPLTRLEDTPSTQWCDHAGVLWFAPVLLAVAQVLDPPEPMFKQGLASLWLGALNLEQTKFLNHENLERLLGTIIRFPHPQRQELARVATEASFAALLGFNARQIGAEGPTDFYFDPHTQHYTGQQEVLKGWCPAIRAVDKALHSDFVHTVAGQPLYFETTDNFADLRERFFEVSARCRAALGWPAERGLTFVVDRGIYGAEVFQKVLASPHLHLITWEKGYQEQSWPPTGGISGRMVMERARNRADDLRGYHLEYVDRLWPKDPRLRQIVVRATNPHGRTIEVAVLTDDLTRPVVEILRFMFNRWIQENDFKYLDKHFGINQITSYRAIPYEQLRQHVQDREVRSGQAKALSQQREQLRARQGRLLLVQEQCDHKACRRQERMQRLENSNDAESAQERAHLRQAQGRYQSCRQQRRQQIETLSQELAALDPSQRRAGGAAPTDPGASDAAGELLASVAPGDRQCARTTQPTAAALARRQSAPAEVPLGPAQRTETFGASGGIRLSGEIGGPSWLQGQRVGARFESCE